MCNGSHSCQRKETHIRPRIRLTDSVGNRKRHKTDRGIHRQHHPRVTGCRHLPTRPRPSVDGDRIETSSIIL
eukprot:scaffold120650_cov36-Attheya_sp.AAC.3